MTTKKDGKASRRDFLKLAGTTAPAAVAAVSFGQSANGEPATVDPGSQTIQDTAHTRAYLASARF